MPHKRGKLVGFCVWVEHPQRKRCCARLQEIAGRECDFRLRFDLCDILSAERCDLVESTEGAEPLAVTGRSVSGHIQPYRLQTIRILLKG